MESPPLHAGFWLCFQTGARRGVTALCVIVVRAPLLRSRETKPVSLIINGYYLLSHSTSPSGKPPFCDETWT
ncbi:hypothetical protein PoB_004501900 [Plakobranchus ocellatus]|uniref:Secreted protein n=1 Tax=Plakobranchus ocellatus TaxID=259542 RepID=A0AAV4BEH0_9GAST|nr:hypothetical protein PoB_004501900 [Plakobranchus ocellatus]